ncbi:DegT/DnrJ/EryC1/StrS family aminotransferase [Candidatus Kaiserbacteria bacterium]|nr:DegT/DnrJ/EryC1/StrS family aminotransferase [Candidatus Kaiserbacteria bacterium]
MDRVPFFDLKRQHVDLRNELALAIEAVMQKSAFSGGEFVDVFEKEFAAYCGANYARGVGSGTAALHLALLALGVGPGDEVIVPSHTFIASAWGISYVGAKPVFVDCTPLTWEIDPTAVEAAVTEKTRAIIGVHLYGVPCDVRALQKIAEEHDLFLVEDCAQAHGALYRDTKVGTIGDIGCFSFYPSKNLGAVGEAGAVVTSDANVAEKVKMFRSHGEKEKYVHEMVGYNERLDGIQAAVLSVKLKHLDTWNTRKAEIVNKYRDGIRNPAVALQTIPEGVTPAYHLFVITTENRKAFVEHMRSLGIDTSMHYPTPCHLQKAYVSLGYTRGDFPHTEYVADHCVSLPLFPEMTEDEIGRVIEAVNLYAR